MYEHTAVKLSINIFNKNNSQLDVLRATMTKSARMLRLVVDILEVRVACTFSVWYSGNLLDPEDGDRSSSTQHNIPEDLNLNQNW